MEKDSVVAEVKKITSNAMLYARIADHLINIAQGLDVRSPEARSRNEGQESLPLEGVQSFDVKAHTLILSPPLPENMANAYRNILSEHLEDIAKFYVDLAANALSQMRKATKDQ